MKSKILRSTDIKSALRNKQRGFVINPFGSAPAAAGADEPITGSVLKLWLDPSDASTLITTDSLIDSITCKKSNQVFNKGGTTNPLLNAAGDLFSLPSIDFGKGTTSWLYSTTGVTITNPCRVFIVCYWRNSASNYKSLSLFKGISSTALQGLQSSHSFIIYTSTGSSPGLVQVITSGSPLIGFWQNTTDGSILTDTRTLVEYKVGATTATSSERVNGIIKSQINNGTTNPASMILTSIGTSDNLYRANGAFGEVMVYQGDMTEADATIVRTYLKTKWGTP